MSQDRQRNKERQLKHENPYDLVTFQSKIDPSVNMACTDELRECNLRSQLSGYPFNIVTHSPLKGKEAEVRKLDEHNVIIPETKIVREFDIVNNN